MNSLLICTVLYILTQLGSRSSYEFNAMKRELTAALK